MASMFSNVFSSGDAQPSDDQPSDDLVPDPVVYDNPDSPDDRGGTDDLARDPQSESQDIGADHGAATGGDDFGGM